MRSALWIEGGNFMADPISFDGQKIWRMKFDFSFSYASETNAHDKARFLDGAQIFSLPRRVEFFMTKENNKWKQSSDSIVCFSIEYFYWLFYYLFTYPVKVEEHLFDFHSRIIWRLNLNYWSKWDGYVSFLCVLIYNSWNMCR